MFRVGVSAGGVHMNLIIPAGRITLPCVMAYPGELERVSIHPCVGVLRPRPLRAGH